MGKTKAGKGTGKKSASSSRVEPSPQRRRINLQDQDDGGTRIGDHSRARPVWKTGSLDKLDENWQQMLFSEKITTQKNPHHGFLYERNVNLEEFRAFGIVQKFEAIGWEVALQCYDGVTNRKYMNPVLEWVGSLSYEGGRSPPRTMRLVGRVRGVEVVMSFDTLSEIAAFDSKPDGRGTNKYIYPSSIELFDKCQNHPRWHQMIADLFMEGADGSMRRDQLKMSARLLLLIVQQNILPRRSDRGYMRHPDVQIVHSLLTGAPRISFRYLVMMNIWYSRNKVDKKTIPYCRLITALLIRYGAIVDTTDYQEEEIPVFNLEGLRHFDWEYERTPRYHKLKNAGKKWRALRLDAEPLEEGEDDEPESEEEDDGDDEEMEEMGGAGSSMPLMGGVPDYYGAHGGYQGMDEFVAQNRPIAWSTWTSYQQAMYDQSAKGFEQNRYDSRLIYNRQEHWNRTHAWNMQQEVNLRWMDDQRRRMRDQWRAGERVVEHPPVVDFTTIPPYDGTMDYPEPPVHHSPWIDPMQEVAQQRGQGSSSNAFNFGSFMDTMKDIFGDPQPPYY